MPDTFSIAFREAFQASILLSLAFFAAPARNDVRLRRSVLLGVLAGFLSGTAAGAVPFLSRVLGSHETWAVWRHVSEAVLFYGSIALLNRSVSPPRGFIAAGMFCLGSLLVLFESRSLGFLIHDTGAMGGNSAAVFGASAGGLLIGLLPLAFLRNHLRKLPFERTFTPATLLMSVGALQFWFGGLTEFGGESIIISLQNGLRLFVSELVQSIQSALLIPSHPFLEVTLAAWARYWGSDRSALTITVLFLLIPPVTILISLFSQPEPALHTVEAGSRRRGRLAAFRQDLALRSAPVLAVFALLVVQIHAVNVSLNPLYDPAPVPVRVAEGSSRIFIPLAGPSGDLGDRKLRKYVYYQASRQVLFLAVMKTDGTVGVALDQCEVCRPADWNKDAQGYAQQGDTLLCKYCVTPIATNTVNTPGGCNPIPVPFTIRQNMMVIDRDELVSIFDKAEALERKGTHL